VVGAAKDCGVSYGNKKEHLGIEASLEAQEGRGGTGMSGVVVSFKVVSAEISDQTRLRRGSGSRYWKGTLGLAVVSVNLRGDPEGRNPIMRTPLGKRRVKKGTKIASEVDRKSSVGKGTATALPILSSVLRANTDERSVKEGSGES